jgi:subtilisin family serine protease
VTLDYHRHLTATPDDPFLLRPDQDYLKLVRLPAAWDRIRSATGQVIAIVDTGVDVKHADLAGRTVTGYNALTNSSTVTDQIGHGTPSAGRT